MEEIGDNEKSAQPISDGLTPTVSAFVHEPEPSSENYPMVKKMLNKLDRFLSRRIAGIAILYMFSMIALGAALVSTGVVHASDGTAVNTGTDVILYSLLGALSFMFMLLVLRFIVIKRNNRKKVANTSKNG